MQDLIWTTIPYEAKKTCPNSEGVYIIEIIKEHGAEIFYIGRSNKLQNRLCGHASFVKNILKGLPSDEVVFVRYALTNESNKFELALINYHNPKHNGSFRSKNISPVVNQIKEAMDGRKSKWLAQRIGLPEHELSRKLTGKQLFNEDELLKIEHQLEFKIDRKNHPLNQN